MRSDDDLPPLRFDSPVTILHGPGAVARQLPAELDALDLERVYIVSSPTTARGPAHELVVRSLGARYAGTFPNVTSQLARSAVDEAITSCRRADADAVLSLGGGSTMDAGKVVRYCLAAELTSTKDIGSESAVDDVVMAAAISHIAVPTTPSGAEFSSVGAFIDAISHRKVFVSRTWLQPSIIVLDPQIAITTPDGIWRSGMGKAIGDAVDLVCGGRMLKVFEPLAFAGITDMVEAARSNEPQIRYRGQLARWTFSLSAGQARPGLDLTSVLRHVLGPLLSVSHAELSCVLVPHVFRAYESHLSERTIAKLATAFGCSPTGQSVRAALFDLMGELQAPRTLVELGADPAVVLSAAAEIAEDVRTVGAAGLRVDVDDIEALLLAALDGVG